MIVSGQASLAGILDLELNGFALGYEMSTFDLFSFGSLLGDFSGLTFDNKACTASGTDRWSCGSAVIIAERLTANSLSLQINNVPEPASLALLGTGMAGLAWSRRRRQQATP